MLNDAAGVRRLSSLRGNSTVGVAMADQHECPLCGGTMRIRRAQTVVYVPGNPQPTTRPDAEWVCPDCDYFEDVEEEKG